MHRRRLSTPLMGGASILVGLAIGLSVPAMATSVATRAAVPHDGRSGGFSHMGHVFVIMMENTSYNDLLNPSNTNTTYIQSIASTYGLATAYSGVTHTSLPNYVAVSSGSTWGSNADDEAQADQGYFNHLSLFDQLSHARVSWRGYMESMPSAGYAGNYGSCTNPAPDPDCTSSSTGTALYVRKHNPFMQYPDIFNNPAGRAQCRTAHAADARPQHRKGRRLQLDHSEHLQRHARRRTELPVPGHTDRREPDGALPGRQQLPADLGHRDHELEGMDGELSDLHHLG